MRRKLEWDGRYETAYGNSLLVMPVGQPDASGTGGRRTADRNLYQNTGLRKEQETQPATDETQPTAAETQPQTVPQQTTEKPLPGGFHCGCPSQPAYACCLQWHCWLPGGIGVEHKKRAGQRPARTV